MYMFRYTSSQTQSLESSTIELPERIDAVGGYNIPDTLQATMLTQIKPGVIPEDYTKVQYHTILANRSNHLKRYVILEMYVDVPETPRSVFLMDGPLLPLIYKQYLPINYGGVFDPATFSIVGGKWAIMDGAHDFRFKTGFVYDHIYRNSNKILVVCQSAAGQAVDAPEKADMQWGVLDQDCRMIPCASESVAQSVYQIFGRAMIAHTSNGNEQMIDANGTPISKEYNRFWGMEGDLIEVRGIDNKHGLVDMDGREVVPAIYNAVKYDAKTRNYIAKRNDTRYMLSQHPCVDWVETPAEQALDIEPKEQAN